MPIRRMPKCMRHTQNHVFAPLWSDNLQTQWQALFVKSARHADRRQAVAIAEESIIGGSRLCSAGLSVLDGRRCVRGGGQQEEVNILE